MKVRMLRGERNGVGAQNIPLECKLEVYLSA